MERRRSTWWQIDLKHNNNLFGNDGINNGNNVPSLSNVAANAKDGAAIGLSKVSACSERPSPAEAGIINFNIIKSLTKYVKLWF